jgi:hypothetical protein
MHSAQAAVGGQAKAGTKWAMECIAEILKMPPLQILKVPI